MIKKGFGLVVLPLLGIGLAIIALVAFGWKVALCVIAFTLFVMVVLFGSLLRQVYLNGKFWLMELANPGLAYTPEPSPAPQARANNTHSPVRRPAPAARQRDKGTDSAAAYAPLYNEPLYDTPSARESDHGSGHHSHDPGHSHSYDSGHHDSGSSSGHDSGSSSSDGGGGGGD